MVFFHLFLIFLINIDLLLLHIAHFDNNIVLLLLVFETLQFLFSVFFYTLNIKSSLLISSLSINALDIVLSMQFKLL